MTDNKTWIERHALTLSVLLVLTGCVLLVISGVTTRHSTGWDNPGVRGDWFGGHLSAFAGLAGMVLMASAVTMQRRELELQRADLRLSRKAAEAQADALHSQDENLKKQNDLMWRRDNRQLMLSFAERHNQIMAIRASDKDEFMNSQVAKKRMLTISETATIFVVETAENYLEIAIDLFRLYMASAVWLPQSDYKGMIEATVLRSAHFNRDGTARLKILEQMEDVMKETRK